MTTALAGITADEFLGLDDNGLELIDGRIEEKPMSANSSRTGLILASKVLEFVSKENLGEVFSSDLGYRIWPERPNHVRKPDVSFIPASRLPDELPSGFLRIAPTLAVEVVSPGDAAEYIEAKIHEYAEAGVRLTWVVFPEARRARVFRDGHETAVIDENGSLDGEDVIPGLSIPLASVLPSKR